MTPIDNNRYKIVLNTSALRMYLRYSELGLGNSFDWRFE